MSPIRATTIVDEATATAIPALRPWLGKQIDLIALPTGRDSATPERLKLTLDQLLAQRVDAPPGTPPLTDEDIRRAIAVGALDGNA